MSIQKLPQGLIDDMTKLMNGEKLGEDVDPKKERLKQKRAKINQEIERAREQIKRIEKQEDQADKAGDDGRGAALSVDRVDLYHKIGYLEDKLDALKEAKKLDPVGKADADIDNDGDTDSSDEYLHKRRQAIKTAMDTEGNKFTGALASAKEKGEKEFTCAGKKYTVDEVEPIFKDDEKGKKVVKEGKLPPALQKAIDKKNGKDTDDEKEVEETTMMSGKPEKKNIYQVRKDMQKSVGDANQKLRDAEQRKKDRIKKMQDDESGNKNMKEELLSIIEKYGLQELTQIFNSLSEKKFNPKFIKLGDEKKNLKKDEIDESRDYYNQVDSLADKHGEEKPFIYKAPKLSKIIGDIKKLMVKEKEFKESQVTGKKMIAHLNKMELMIYSDNAVMTNTMHKKVSKDFQGDTAFREDLAEIIYSQDPILSYAIFGE